MYSRLLGLLESWNSSSLDGGRLCLLARVVLCSKCSVVLVRRPSVARRLCYTPPYHVSLSLCIAAPYRDVKTAVERGSLGDLNPTPWAFMTGNCLGWVTYSFILQNLFIFFANAPGFVLSVWFNMCAVKLQYEDHRAREMRRSFVNFLESSRNNVQQQQQQDGDNAWQKAKDLGKIVVQVTSQQTPAPAGQEKLVMGMVLVWLGVISILSFANFDANTRQLIVGFVVNANLLFFYGAPLSTIFKVLKTRNSASIHIRTMITNTLNGTFWTAYGFAKTDPFIYVPNGIGAILGVIQFFLCILFPRRPTIAADAGEEGEPAVELESFAAKEDTVEEGLSPSNSHESIARGVGRSLKQQVLVSDSNELVTDDSESS